MSLTIIGERNAPDLRSEAIPRGKYWRVNPLGQTKQSIFSQPEHALGSPRPETHPFGRASSVLNGIKARLDAWSARRRERAALLSLGDAELKDLGISRAQALFEYNKP